MVQIAKSPGHVGNSTLYSAAQVYAVEASNMAETARELAVQNRLSDKLIVIKGRIEDIEVPEPVVCACGRLAKTRHAQGAPACSASVKK